MNKLHDALNASGLPDKEYGTHSFRRGGASYAFQAGIPLELIKILGDWKSNIISVISHCSTHALPENSAC